MTTRPVQRPRRLGLLWYRSLPFLAQRCLCSLVLRLMAGMSAEDAGKLYHFEATPDRAAVQQAAEGGEGEA